MKKGIALGCVVLLLALGSCALPAGSGDSGSGTSDTNSGPSVMTCPSCDGGGNCNMCYGDGINPLDNLRRQPCVTCHGSGRCSRCRGTGTIRY